MGYSFFNRIVIVFAKENVDAVDDWLNSLPVEVKTNYGAIEGLRVRVTGEPIVILDSEGYGVFDIEDLPWPEEIKVDLLLSASFVDMGRDGKAQVNWCSDDSELKEASWSFDPDSSESAYFDVDGMLSMIAEKGDWDEDDEDADRLQHAWDQAMNEAWKSVYRRKIEELLGEYGVGNGQLRSLLSDPFNQNILSVICEAGL
jgi:hypothetical protein